MPLTIVLDAVSKVLTSLHDVTRSVQIVFRSMYDAISSWFRVFLKSFADLTPIVDYLKKALQEASKGLILFSARVALAFAVRSRLALSFVPSLRWPP